MRISNSLPGLLILILSIVVLLGTWPLSYWSGTAPGPGFLPVWLALGGTVLFVLQCVEAFRSRDGLLNDWPDGSALARPLASIIGLTAFGVFLPILGTLLTAALFVIFVLIFVLQRPIWPTLLTTAIILAVLEMVFARWLSIPLPTFSLVS